MESPVEIRYAGVVIGRAQEVRRNEGDSSTFFVAVREPMPVGSVVHLRTGDRETSARVVHTVESGDAATSGFRVRLIGESEEVGTDWIPPPAPVVEKAHPVEEPAKTAMPVIEVDMSAVRAPTDVGVDTRLRRAPEELGGTAGTRAEQTEFGFPSAGPPEAAAAEPSNPDSASATGAVAAAGATATIEVVGAESATVTVSSVTDPASSEAVAPAAAPASSDEAATASTSAAPAKAATEELPPARPIAGPSGRRKTKRRK